MGVNRRKEWSPERKGKAKTRLEHKPVKFEDVKWRNGDRAGAKGPEGRRVDQFVEREAESRDRSNRIQAAKAGLRKDFVGF
jgi:hypothetical protein